MLGFLRSSRCLYAYAEAIKANLPQALVFSTLVVMTLSVTSIVSTIMEDRRKTREYYRALNETFAISVATHVEQTLKRADQILMANRVTFLNNRRDLPRQLKVHNKIIDRSDVPLEGVIGPDGRMLISTTPTGITTKPLDLSDRAHFRFHADHTFPERDEIYMSEIIIGRLSGKPALQISRSFRDQNNTLLAVGVVSLNPDIFIEPFRQLVKPAGSAISIIGTDKLGRIQITADTTRYSIDYSASSTFSKILEKMGHGSLEAVSTVDGKDRLYGFAKVSGFPLVTTVSTSIDDLQAESYGSKGTSAMVGLLLLISLTALLLMAIWTQRLNIRLKKSNRLLVSNVRQMELASHAQRQMMASISHEIRTPLHGITGHAQLLTIGSTSDDLREESAIAILEAAKYLRKIVGQLLHLGRMEAGKERVELKPEPLATIILEVCHLHQAAAARSGLEFRTRLDDINGLLIDTDAIALRRILNNLISNAVKFTPIGSVEIEALRWEKEWIKINIRDTGIGVPPEHFGTIFDHYNELSQLTNSKVAGTGLGLALCRKLSKLLGGTLTVESLPGSGSTFTLILPLHQRSRSQVAAALAPTPAPPA